MGKLTLNIGARFDRYRVWLPEQEIPVARFNPVAIPLAEISDSSLSITSSHAFVSSRHHGRWQRRC